MKNDKDFHVWVTNSFIQAAEFSSRTSASLASDGNSMYALIISDSPLYWTLESIIRTFMDCLVWRLER